MARNTKEQSAATAAAVLGAARELYSCRGYVDVAVEEVATAAGVTRGAVYHHFGSRQGLFTAVLEQVQQQVAEQVQHAAQAAGEDAWEQLVAGCRAFLTASTQAGVRRLLLVEAPAVLGWARWRELDARHSRRLLHEGVRELLGAGRLRTGPGIGVEAGAVVAVLSGAMDEAASWAASSPDPQAAAEQAWQVLHLLLGALRADAPAAGAGPGDPSSPGSTGPVIGSRSGP
ncbi:TetR/AcrR family transcriptional regulator [Paenibacillus sp. TRM 82003]|uniref:TetR/AcrR family transcriptional regulator n=1 Tax=Kineococcus sp. TRM81007 TaxID=2925831 RepID=UPI001F59E262|nr:TetR/AcrR family transcriptional regulator [Kineococcus sp. TRM81007]MCI2237989.1 TetR/AcrR family transcriptional regulator [Kineococcus sp. TRM81007]MCI3926004.1 TetR/AcrR family transcriptional regulator [Paenibacillus sp. TRM 82003]